MSAQHPSFLKSLFSRILSSKNMKTLSMTDLYSVFKMKNKENLFLDVREPDEFRLGHVPGSKNIPHEKVKAHAAELKRYETVYLYCRSGRRSTIAYQVLSNEGLDNLICVKGSGMEDWLKSGFEVEK